MLKAIFELLLPARVSATSFRTQPPLPCAITSNHRLHTTWRCALRSKIHESVSKSCWKFVLRKYHRFVQDSRPSCGGCAITALFGLSLVRRSVGLWPQIGHCTNGFEFEFGVHDPKGMLDPDEDRRALLSFVRKLPVPFFIFSTVLMNWGHPFVIVTKVPLILFTTKPSPSSVYLYIEELRQQFVCQLSFICLFKSYSGEEVEVEVEVYMFLCLSRVNLKGQKLELVGILGNWWTLPLYSWREAFTISRSIGLCS